jgi:hypothetical protein
VASEIAAPLVPLKMTNPSLPTTWAGRRPLRVSQWYWLAAVQVTSFAAQVVGLREMNRAAGAPASADGPLAFYYVGFLLQIVVMFMAVVIRTRKVRIALTPDEIRVGARVIARATATLRMADRKRLGRAGREIRIDGSGEVARIWAPATPRHPADEVALSPRSPEIAPQAAASRIDAVIRPLDFDELASTLDPLAAGPQELGTRIDLSPYRATARSALETIRPWFVTIGLFSVAGPTLGPLIARTPVGPLILPPLSLFAACIGIVATLAAFDRPRRGLRLIVGARELTVSDVHSGAVVTRAPLGAVRATRFNYTLFGRMSRWTNPGLRLELPDGFTLAIAVPLQNIRNWPNPVVHSWAPRWTTAPEQAMALLKSVGIPPY